MSDASLPLQAAVVAALKASLPLAALVGTKIYDRVPDATAAPYVKLSGWQEINDDTDCSDSSEVFFDVQCYSTAVGRPQVANIASAVKAALNKLEPSVTGFSGTQILHRSTLYFYEADGTTERAVVNFHALIDSN
jgi:hypothetical protein